MARNPRHDILFEPIQIGPKTLKNRFYQVPHCTGFGTYKPLSQSTFRTIKAEGGWAAVCTEFAPISPESDNIPSAGSNLWDENDAANLAEMCKAVQRHGALAGIELVHKGSQSRVGESRWHRIGPSQVPSDTDATFVPKEMDERDIARVLTDWETAAKRARDIGFDIVYVYVGEGYLPMQFASPFFNRRTDAYGGSLENRARFLVETLQAVNKGVSGDCAVAVRMSVDARGPAGLSLAETLKLIPVLDQYIDLWDVKIGVISDPVIDSTPSRFFKDNHQFEWTGKLRGVTAKPIVGVGRLTDPDTMVANISSGGWDIVGAARPSIADPYLPLKIQSGRYDEIRECIGNNECLVKHMRGHIGCSQNATAGEEYRRGWHPEEFTPATNADRDVLVVGAGIAGMECAIVLAKRGFRRVHIVDANKAVGGAFRWIPTLPGLGEWARLVNWRSIQLKKLPNVELITGVRLSADTIRDYGAELVVIATGARWTEQALCPVTHDAVPGGNAALPHVFTPEQLVLQNQRPQGRQVLVYDSEGDFMGTCLAEKLASEGFEVTFATPFDQIAPGSIARYEGAYVKRRLHWLGIRMHRGVVIGGIYSDRVEAVDEYGEQLRFDVQGTVIVTHRVSNQTLYRELVSRQELLSASGIEAVYRTGGCIAPVNIAETIFDGHRLAREIDSADPSLPLPYKREQSFLNRSLPTIWS